MLAHPTAARASVSRAAKRRNMVVSLMSPSSGLSVPPVLRREYDLGLPDV
jgi:hypothetical protein